jgi:hypothetical protein
MRLPCSLILCQIILCILIRVLLLLLLARRNAHNVVLELSVFVFEVAVVLGLAALRLQAHGNILLLRPLSILAYSIPHHFFLVMISVLYILLAHVGLVVGVVCL